MFWEFLYLFIPCKFLCLVVFGSDSFATVVWMICHWNFVDKLSTTSSISFCFCPLVIYLFYSYSYLSLKYFLRLRPWYFSCYWLYFLRDFPSFINSSIFLVSYSNFYPVNFDNLDPLVFFFLLLSFTFGFLGWIPYGIYSGLHLSVPVFHINFFQVVFWRV